MSTRSGPTLVVASDGDAGLSCGPTTLSGKVRLLTSPGGAASLRVRLDAGAVTGADGWQAGPVSVDASAVFPGGGGCSWGWRDRVETVRGGTGIEVRRLGIVDERGVAVGDVSDDVVAQVMPLLRVGTPVDVGARLSELVGFVSSLADPDALVQGVDFSTALCPADGPSFPDDASWARPADLDTGLPTDAPGCVLDGLWTGALGYGTVDDEATGFRRQAVP